jgi:hypothetical protein
VGRVADNVVLIDGETLANLMIDHIQRGLKGSPALLPGPRLTPEIDALTIHTTPLPQFLQRASFPSGHRSRC